MVSPELAAMARQSLASSSRTWVSYLWRSRCSMSSTPTPGSRGPPPALTKCPGGSGARPHPRLRRPAARAHEVPGELGAPRERGAEQVPGQQRDVLAPRGEARHGHPQREARQEVVLERGGVAVGGGDEADVRAPRRRSAE